MVRFFTERRKTPAWKPAARAQGMRVVLRIEAVFPRLAPRASRHSVPSSATSKLALSAVAWLPLGLDARRLGLTPSYLPAEAIAPLESRSRDAFAAVSRAELGLYMGNTLLRDADTNSMAHSLEVRVPFLGQRLVDRVSRPLSLVVLGSYLGKVARQSRSL